MAKYLKLGVMANMKNNSFIQPTFFDTTLYYITAAGDAEIFVNSVVPTLFATLGKNDKIKIGPSTHSDNPNATEEVSVNTGCTYDNGSVSSIQLNSGILFSYSAGDPVAGVGSYFPDKWTAPTYDKFSISYRALACHPRLNCLNLPVSTRDTTFTRTFNNTFGVDDYFCFKAFGKQVLFTSGNQDILKYIFTVGNLLLATYYRIGFFYRYKVFLNIGTGFSFKYTFYDGATALANMVTVFTETSSKEKTDWQYYVSDSLKTNASISADGYIQFFHVFTSCTGEFYSNIDSVFVEHAKGTDDDTDGVYTFTEMPARGTQNWNFTDFTQKNRLASGDYNYGQMDSRKAPRWKFTCQFENVSADFFKNLVILSGWQQLGYNLVLHTTEDFGSNTYRIPPVLVGNFIMSNITKNAWERSRKSFTFEFIGTV